MKKTYSLCCVSQSAMWRNVTRTKWWPKSIQEVPNPNQRLRNPLLHCEEIRLVHRLPIPKLQLELQQMPFQKSNFQKRNNKNVVTIQTEKAETTKTTVNPGRSLQENPCERVTKIVASPLAETCKRVHSVCFTLILCVLIQIDNCVQTCRYISPRTEVKSNGGRRNAFGKKLVSKMMRKSTMDDIVSHPPKTRAIANNSTKSHSSGFLLGYSLIIKQIQSKQTHVFVWKTFNQSMRIVFNSIFWMMWKLPSHGLLKQKALKDHWGWQESQSQLLEKTLTRRDIEFWTITTSTKNETMCCECYQLNEIDKIPKVRTIRVTEVILYIQ